jgi:purine catabolism regulator
LLIELGKRGILTDLRRRRQPVRVPPHSEHGLASARIVAPIVAGQELYGYVWMVVRDRANDELDMIAIQHAATVAALILLKEKEVYQVEQRLKTLFLDELLTGDADLQRTLMARSRYFQFDLTQGQQILLLRQRDQVALSSLHRWLEEQLSEPRPSGLTVQRAQHLVLLLPSERTEEGEVLARRLWEQGQADGYDLLIGVGRAYAGWDRLSESYDEAQEALEIGPPLTGRSVVLFDDLGVLHWLHHLPPEVRGRNRFSQAVERLAQEDAERQGDLIETLETYLDAGQNGQEAARQLYIHRNTLRQRLDKIEAICNLKLNDSLVDLNLHVAVKEYKLRQQE